MPSYTDLVINDGKSTPVAHTFSPAGIKEGILALFEEKVGVPMSRRLLDVSVRKPVSNNGMYRVRVTWALPKVNTIDGVPTLDHTNRFTSEFLIHERSDQDEINDLYAFAFNGLGNTQIKEAIRTLTPFFS